MKLLSSLLALPSFLALGGVVLMAATAKAQEMLPDVAPATTAPVTTTTVAPHKAIASHKGHHKKTPAERAARRAELKAKFDALPPEEQARIKAERAAKRAERKAKFEALPPAEKARIKAERKKKREARLAKKAAAANVGVGKVSAAPAVK